MSRQTVRNALRRLGARGVIESRAGSGHFVRNPADSNRPPRNPERTTRQIGIICPPKLYLDEARQWRMLAGVQSRVSQEGYSLVISVSEKDSRTGFAPSYQHWLEDGEVEGYMGVSIPAGLQKELHESGRPALALGYVWEDIPLASVAVDFRAVYEKILKHLASCGHERVGAVLNLPDTRFTEKVSAGLRDGMAALGWEEGQVAVKRYHKNAYELVNAVRGLLNAPAPPTALILQGEDYFGAVAKYLEAEKISPPKDLHLFVTQSSTAINAAWAGRLGYFDFDYFKIGQAAGQRLLDLIAGIPPESLHQEILIGDIVDASAPAPEPATA